jgi:class 3 adenylate cyclase/tetratricopeptide (TPR) repeat protein
MPPKSYSQAHIDEQVATARGALEGERKQATVLFCDIANSTALAERIGAEAMHALLNRFFELALGELHRYECTINQFGGDGFMALAPAAHEDHARRAVLAALGIQQMLHERRQDLGPGCTELAVRIGINTGPVVVGTIGDNLRTDYTAVGDTTNLAARLQQHAEPGTILISHATYDLIRDDVQAERLEPIAVKGKSKAIISYKVAGAVAARSSLRGLRDRALSKFVGRDRHIAELSALFAEVGEGRGQIVGIVGEPGTGKSRLLYEFRQGLDSTPVTYLEGRCLSYGSSIPYVPILEIMRQKLGIVEADPVESIAAKIQSGVADVGLDPTEEAPIVLLFLGLKDGSERVDMLTPEIVKARTFDVLRRLTLGCGKERPLILAIEDLHWIDKISEEFLTSLVENLSGVPILLLCTYRPGYSPTWIEKSYATQMSLRPLSSQDSLQVLQSVAAARDLPEPIATKIIDKAEGNPLFLEELARAVAMTQGGDTITFGMPDTIQGVLQARIDRLGEAPKRMLQTASVIGREVPLWILRAVWARPESLDVHILELKRQEFLYERSTGGHQVYVFKHALTQEVAYETLLSPARQALHEATARTIEATYQDRLEEHYERLAHHYFQTQNQNKTLKYLELANQKAAKSHALQEAFMYFERAVSLLDKMPDTQDNRRQRVAMIANQWVVFFLLFRVQEYHDLLIRHQDMANSIGESGLLAYFELNLGLMQTLLGRLEEALSTITNAVRISEVAGEEGGAGPAYTQLQFIHFWLGNLEQALLCQQSALHTLRQRFDLRWYAWTLAASSWTYSYLGRCDEAVEEALKELALAEKYHDNSLASFAYWNMSLAYTCKGDFAKAIERAEMAVQKAPTPAGKIWAQTHLAWAWCRAGRALDAVELLTSLVPNYDDSGFVGGQIFSRVYLGEAYWRAGQLNDAERTLLSGLEMASRAGFKFYAGSFHRLLGEIALEKNPEQVREPFAAPQLEASISILHGIKAENELALALAAYGRLYKRRGRSVDARDYLTRALKILERLGTMIETEKVRTELAQLATGA